MHLSVVLKVTTLYNVCSVHRGVMCSTSGDIMSTSGEIMSTPGDIMSTLGDIMMHVGDIMSTSEDVQYIGGCSVHWSFQ